MSAHRRIASCAAPSTSEPEFSYMVGCSNGGRHALVGATRLADEFDGFLAGAPGYNLSAVALQHAWDVQSFERVADDIRRAFSREDMRLVADEVLEQCDALDGAFSLAATVDWYEQLTANNRGDVS